MLTMPMPTGMTPDYIEFLPDGRLIAGYVQLMNPIRSVQRWVAQQELSKIHLDIYDAQTQAYVTRAQTFFFRMQDMIYWDTTSRSSYNLHAKFLGTTHQWQISRRGLDRINYFSAYSLFPQCTPFGYSIIFTGTSTHLTKRFERHFYVGVAEWNKNPDVQMEELNFNVQPSSLVFGSNPETFVALYGEGKAKTMHHNGRFNWLNRNGGPLTTTPFAIATGPDQSVILARRGKRNQTKEILFVDNITGDVVKSMEVGTVSCLALSPDNLILALGAQGKIIKLDLDW